MLRVVDIFSGGGGLSMGFERAGFEIVAAFDNWEPAVNFYEANLTHPVIRQDLSNVESSTARVSELSPDLIIGGPPCQDFSSAGKRDENLGRADLTIAYAKIVTNVRTPFFVMENVERAVSSSAFTTACEILRGAGYGMTVKILNASRCGVPQIRKRLIVVGAKGESDGFLESELDSGLAERELTVREYLGDKIRVRHYYRHPRSYARRAIFSVDEPSPTVRGVNRPVPAGYPGHPGDRAKVSNRLRSLTTRERALIQTFPQDVKLIGSKTHLEQIIGNAVPPNLAYYVARALGKFIHERNSKATSKTA